MSQFLTLTEAKNSDSFRPLLEAFTNLKDVQLRTRWEQGNGVFLAESHNVIERALQAGYAPVAFLTAPKWAPKLSQLLVAAGNRSRFEQPPIIVASEEETEQLAGFAVHRGSIGLFHRPEPLDVDVLLKGGDSRRCVAVLEDLVDHTNVGAIFRSAAALGVSAILVSPGCADPLYRRSIRVSMGAVFQIPWARLANWPHTGVFSRHGYVTAALTPSVRARPLESYFDSLTQARTLTRVALLLGSEGPGLKVETLAQADVSLKISLDAGVDSLNVSTAASLGFWEARRYRNSPR